MVIINWYLNQQNHHNHLNQCPKTISRVTLTLLYIRVKEYFTTGLLSL